MATGALKKSAGLDRAIANLLRLANSEVKDAELLSSGRHPDNANLLLHIAFQRIVEAIIVTEKGWPPRGTQRRDRNSLAQIPEQNPLKLGLADLSKLAAQPAPLSLLPDGSIPQTFDHDAFRRHVSGLRKLLQDSAARFGVDLLGNGPAQQGVAAPPQSVSKPAAPPPIQKSQPKIAISKKAPRAAAKVTGKVPAENKNPPTRIVIPDTRPQPKIIPAAPRVQSRSPIEVTAGRATTTSTAFWQLMDRWQVADLASLALIGHGGGLTQKATRPRFKLQPEETEMLKLLLELDQAVANLGLDPAAWVNKPIKEPPFEGANPIAYLSKNGLAGPQKVARYILKNGLKLSMAAPS